MIVNYNLAPVTQAVTDLYWQDENNVARINRIVQYILEREYAQQSVQRTDCQMSRDGKHEFGIVHGLEECIYCGIGL